MKRKSQFLALFLALCLAVSMLAVPAAADAASDLAAAEKALTDANAALKSAENALKEANSSISSEQSAYDSAKLVTESKQSDYDTAKAAVDSKQQAYDDATTDEEKNAIQNELNELKSTAERLEGELATARGNEERAKTALDEAKNTADIAGKEREVSAAKATADQAKKDYDVAKAAADDEKKKQEEAAAQATKPTSSDISCTSSVDFGTLSKGTTGSSLTKSFTIKNTGSKTIVLSSSSVSGYSISGASGTLAAGNSTTVTVTLNSASSTGSFDGTLRLTASFEGSSETYNFSVSLYATVKDTSNSITADPATKDLGKLTEGYTDKQAKEKEFTVTIKNNGGTTVHLNGFKGDDHFTVTAVKDKNATLESGKSEEFKIVPRQSLAVGTYTDTITFQTTEGVTTTFKPTIVIQKAVAALTVEPTLVDFGTVEEGYAQPSVQTITLKNNTDGALRLEQPSSYSYEFSQLGAVTLAAGGTTTMTIRPRAGLPENNYNGQVSFQAGNETAKLDVRFIVNRKSGPSTFSDVAAGSTFAADISYVSQKGLMSGKSATEFAPQSPITRGQLVTILYRLEGQPAVSGTGFSDVAAGSYCENAVKWAAATGVTTGSGDGTFKPNDPISRQQLATFLYRYNNLKGYQTSRRADLSTFSDSGSVASYAAEALSWANGMSLVNGTSDGRLNPEGGATRGQAAAILHRFCVSIGK